MKATELPSIDLVKLLYIGNSGTGKTGSLLSLLQAGYDLRILDMDVGLHALLNYTKLADPSLLADIDAQTFRDKFTADPVKGIRISGTPKAYIGAIKALNKWDDETIPAEWGAKTVLVLDSLTAFGRSAFFWAQGMNPTAKDPRQWYGTAQESVKNVLDMLTDPAFNCHVIVISHIQPITDADGNLVREQVSSIGKALGPEIPKAFNVMLAATSSGSGNAVKRTIRTAPTTTLDLRIPVELEKSLPLETGMATVFESLLAIND